MPFEVEVEVVVVVEMVEEVEEENCCWMPSDAMVEQWLQLWS